MTGFVYLIDFDTTRPTALLKIGSTSSPKRRFYEHRKIYPNLKVLRVWSVSNYWGLAETYVFNALPYTFMGETFFANRKQLEFIEHQIDVIICRFEENRRKYGAKDSPWPPWSRRTLRLPSLRRWKV